MTRHTPSDAKTESNTAKTRVPFGTEARIAVRSLDTEWIEIEAMLPSDDLAVSDIRIRGRVLTIEAARPRLAGGLDVNSGIERVTLRFVLSHRPAARPHVRRSPEGLLSIRIAINPPDGATRAIDGMGAAAAHRLADGRRGTVTTHAHLQDADVPPHCGGGLSAS